MLGFSPSRPLLLDGAIGTELIARGMRLREECPESWNLADPDQVSAVHRSYVEAGAQVIQTNSFGLTKPRLEKFGLADRQREIGDRAVELARSAAAGAQVWGSLGPTGKTLPLDGSVDRVWLEEAFRDAACALAGVDAIHIETMFHPAEMEAAIRGAKSAGLGVPVYASMTLMPGVTGLETPHGVPIARMIRAVEAGEPDAVGVNCSIDAERMYSAVAALAAAFSVPIVAKPQAKMSDKCASGRSSESPESFARHALKLIDAGAGAVGGCCGVGPASIAVLGRLMRASAGSPLVGRGRVEEVQQ